MRCEITREPLRLEPLIEEVRTDACGAVAAFLGVVRESDETGRAVSGLAYEAYPAMAEPEMRAIAEEALTKFGAAHIAIAHRIGELGLGEASVAIAVGAEHRSAAFDACEYAIDELKRRVPIWKKEQYRDGASRWRPNETPAPSS